MFKLEKFMDKRVLKSTLLEDFDVSAFFTTRDLPLKYGEREDLKEEIENNKKLLCEGLNIPLGNLIIPIQTHSDNIEVIFDPSPRPSPPRGEGAINSPFENTDALITNLPNIAIALNFADCVPIIFYDPVKKVIAVAHAGWKGTASKIAQKTVEKMVNEFSISPKDVIALIGPAIGRCCFEVEKDVLEKILKTVAHDKISLVLDYRQFGKAWFSSLGRAGALRATALLPKSANMRIDLKLVNKFQLLASGVEKIDLCEDCTCCKNDLFFSYRKEKGNTQRHSAVAMLSDE